MAVSPLHESDVEDFVRVHCFLWAVCNPVNFFENPHFYPGEPNRQPRCCEKCREERETDSELQKRLEKSHFINY